MALEPVSIPDGDSFLREVNNLICMKYKLWFQSPMGIVSSAKAARSVGLSVTA